MWNFEHGAAGAGFDITYTVPSVCAEALRAGTSDIGIIPVAAYASIPELIVLPDIAIAARGAVRSILLIAKAPLEQVRSIATDTSSRTSVALMRVISRRWYGGNRQYTAMPPDLASMLAACDAALLIGDAALTADKTGLFVYDLAELWRQHTGLPFVFAFWGVRAEAAEQPGASDLPRIFRDSRDQGLRPGNVATIAQEWAPKLRLSETEIVRYLTENVHYELDGASLEGLSTFFAYSVEHHILPQAPVLRFLGGQAAASRPK